MGDDSNLTLDPDLDTYYLQDIVVTKVPSLLNQLGEVQILLQDSEADGLPVSKYATRFVALEALLRATLGSLNNNLATAYRDKPGGDGRGKAVHIVFGATIAAATANPSHNAGLRSLPVSPRSRALSGALRSGLGGPLNTCRSRRSGPSLRNCHTSGWPFSEGKLEPPHHE